MNFFLTSEDEAELVEEIRAQEARTSAEIRVCVTYRFVWRHERFAWRVFDRSGMRNTRHRNGALIVMMPLMKKVVILGDSGLHAVVAPDYWNDAVRAMVRQMHDAGPLAALREGLRLLGDTLAAAWPREDGDVNELPDEIL
jgi:uncharacterized membrane protein